MAHWMGATSDTGKACATWQGTLSVKAKSTKTKLDEVARLGEQDCTRDSQQIVRRQAS